ncbi:MAG: hypothetical protein OCD01_00260 [Fibrobacterales bacterium]
MKSKPQLLHQMLIIMSVSILVIVLMLWNSALTMREQAIGSVKNAVVLAAQSISSEFQSTVAQVELYSQLHMLKEMEPKAFLPFLKRELNRQKGRYEKFIVGTIDGHFYNTAGGNPSVGYLRTFDDTAHDAQPKSIAGRDYWKYTVGDNDFHVTKSIISEPMISYTTAAKQIVIASSIIEERGIVSGMVGVSITWQRIEQLFKKLSGSYFSQYSWEPKIAIVSRNGSYWYHWDKNKTLKLKRDTAGALVYDEHGQVITESFSLYQEKNPRIRDEHKSILFDRSIGYIELNESYGEGERVVFYAPIQETGYTLMLEVDSELLLEEIDYIQALYILIVILCLSTIIAIVMNVIAVMKRKERPVVQK